MIPPPFYGELYLVPLNVGHTILGGTHVQGVRLNHAIFASKEVILSR
jgi:hypothetical protein